MILVTGGTGFVGQDVVRQLLALGYKVRLLVRHPKSTTPFAGNPGVEIVAGDALKPETLPAAMSGVSVVIHLIGIIKETGRVTFEQAHVEATRNVLVAAKKAGVTRWIQMSAAGTRPEARSRYHVTKWQAEELVRQSGLDWTIFRPSLVYGYDERDRLLNLHRMLLSSPLDFIQLYTFPVLNGGQNLVQPVSLREVAHCFAHAPARGATISHTFDLVGPVSFSWREMVGKIAHALGKSLVYEEIPFRVGLRILLWLAVVFLPIAMIYGLIRGELNFFLTEIAAALWFGLVVTAVRWRKLIIFSVPLGPFEILSAIFNRLAPRGLQFSEQLKMIQEDNVGNPEPATRVFAYEPESFEQG